MIDFNISNGLIIFLFFLLSSMSGTLLMYLISKYIFKMIIDESLDYNRSEVLEILDEYKEHVEVMNSSITNVQTNITKRFELINEEIQALSKVLVQFKLHMLKVENLESEIVKYKKIIKRLEKR